MIIYQLYIDKFNKDIVGLINKLDYLADFGTDAIWIMPHYPSPMIDGGYDVTDYVNVRQDLGSLKDFELLTHKAHEKGLKIIIDLILNHTSTEHEWFKQARASKNNSERDYYIWSSTGTDLLSATNAFPNIKLSNWIYNPFTRDYYFSTFYPLQPDLNWDNPQVLDKFINIIDFWANLGVDGFRLDAITHLIKRNYSLSVALPETHIIVNKIRKHIDSKFGNKLLIGEADLHSYKAKEYFGKSDECHMLFDFEGSVKLINYLLCGDERILSEIPEYNKSSPLNTEWLYFLGSHDCINTNLLDPPAAEKLTHLLDPEGIYQNTHDKRLALRLGEIFKSEPKKIIYAYTQLMNLPGSKVIYYGDEIGMRNSPLQGSIIDNRFGVRGDFDWAEQEKQAKDDFSIYKSIKNIIRTSKHPKPKSS